MKMFWPLLALLVLMLAANVSCRASACKQAGVSQPIQLMDEPDATQMDVKDTEPG